MLTFGAAVTGAPRRFRTRVVDPPFGGLRSTPMSDMVYATVRPYPKNNGPPPGSWIGVMLLKSLAVSVAAALLGPALGVAMFFLANSSAGGQPLAYSQARVVAQPAGSDLVRSFAPSENWYAHVATEELGAWQTVVRCPDGQALPAGGRCQPSDTQPPA